MSLDERRKMKKCEEKKRKNKEKDSREIECKINVCVGRCSCVRDKEVRKEGREEKSRIYCFLLLLLFVD